MTTIGGSPTDSRFTAVGLLAAIGMTGVVLVLPTPEGLPPEAHRMAALFVGVLVLWSTEALPIAVTSLLALALQPLFRLTSLVADRPPTTGAIFGAAVANFMSSVFFFVLVMFAIALAWVKTGLARRFALWMIAQAGTDARRTVYVFMIGTALISMIVSDVPAAAIFMAIAVGILDKLELRPGSRFGRVVMIGIPIAALIGGVGTPAGAAMLADKATAASAEPALPAALPPTEAQLAAETQALPRSQAVDAFIVEQPGSDYMVDVLRALDIEYCASNCGSSQTARGALVCSAAQSLKLDRNPCGVMSARCHRDGDGQPFIGAPRGRTAGHIARLAHHSRRRSTVVEGFWQDRDRSSGSSPWTRRSFDAVRQLCK